jgi:hypothetical protein
MEKRCPRCGATVRCERSARPVVGPIKPGDPVVDLWFRCGVCGLRIDASGVGDADAERDLDMRIRGYDRTRKIRLSDGRGPRRRR